MYNIHTCEMKMSINNNLTGIRCTARIDTSGKKEGVSEVYTCLCELWEDWKLGGGGGGDDRIRLWYCKSRTCRRVALQFESNVFTAC